MYSHPENELLSLILQLLSLLQLIFFFKTIIIKAIHFFIQKYLYFYLN